MTLILVEDDEPVRRSLKMLLELDGYAVLDYATGSAAIEAGRNLWHKCLIADYQLPDLDGLALIAAFKANGRYGPSILMTGHFNDTLEKRALDAGYHVVLQKPFQFYEVSTAIAQLTSRY